MDDIRLLLRVLIVILAVVSLIMTFVYKNRSKRIWSDTLDKVSRGALAGPDLLEMAKSMLLGLKEQAAIFGFKGGALTAAANLYSDFGLGGHYTGVKGEGLERANAIMLCWMRGIDDIDEKISNKKAKLWQAAGHGYMAASALAPDYPELEDTLKTVFPEPDGKSRKKYRKIYLESTKQHQIPQEQAEARLAEREKTWPD